MNDRLLLRPSEAALTLGISRTKAYELIANGAIPSVRVGSSVRVPVEALRNWVNNQVAGAANAATGIYGDELLELTKR